MEVFFIFIFSLTHHCFGCELSYVTWLREAYQKQLAEAFNVNHTRILAFKNKPPTPVELIPKDLLYPPPPRSKSSKPRQYIPQEGRKMVFGQVLIGPPGSVKTTYCNGMSQFLNLIGRKVAVINLDPANDSLPYGCAVNIEDLVKLSDVMVEHSLGPNGG